MKTLGRIAGQPLEWQKNAAIREAFTHAARAGLVPSSLAEQGIRQLLDAGRVKLEDLKVPSTSRNDLE